MADSRTYFRVADDIDENPKMLELSNQAFRLDLHGISYCARRQTDGKVPKAMVARLLTGPVKKALAELTKGARPRWIEHEDHYEIRDYLEHQRSKAHIDSLSNARREAGKRGGKPKAKPEAKANQNITQRTEDRGQRSKEELNPSSSAPQNDIEAEFENFWKNYPKRNGKRVFKEKARAIWKRLNYAERSFAQAGVGHYAAACEQELTIAQDAYRWLRDRAFVDWQEPAKKPVKASERSPYVSPSWGRQQQRAEPKCEHSNPMCADCRRANLQKLRAVTDSVGGSL